MKGCSARDLRSAASALPRRAADLLRPLARDLPASRIRAVANAGMEREGVIPLWFGESDMETPTFIREAAKKALDQGHTFYTQNEGIPTARAAIAAYLTALHSVSVEPARVAVTASGMAAITVVMQALLDPGDNLVVHTPIWPNCRDAAHIIGAETRPVELQPTEAGWHLDLDRFLDQVDQRTRVLFFNSPNNPTGWVMSEEQQRAVLDFCRTRGIWLVADEVYDRIVYPDAAPDHRTHAPSFVAIAEPHDPVIAINSFSKSWCMTGWRMGWLTAPAEIVPTLGKIIEFNYSSVARFIQTAGITALEEGEDFITNSVARYRAGRDLVYERLAGIPRLRMSLPQGAFYAFFAVEGMADSLAFARRLLEETNVGLAPGSAFGPGGEGFLRLCFASRLETLSRAVDRLEAAL